MEDLIQRPNGIILVTGPTGAGKTTTLYACLNKINSPELNILTVEDPVEYELKGISQMHVQPKIGLTFASGLRSFLRQDPDVIMVGEIRDHETAEIAIHASLTGHLVFSTLHTNNAAGAVARLVEMEIQPFLISSSLLAVIAQRLVRRLCKQCKQPYTPTDEDLRSLEVDVQGERPVFYRAKGCEACTETGYSGRVGIYELLVVDDPVRRAILSNTDANTITRIAAERGMITLRADGARQVLAGKTSMEEVLAATHAGETE
jgi:general secretion pathway protein E